MWKLRSSMQLMKRILILFALVMTLMSMTGCLDREMDDSSIPWSRPAGWEDRVPGFGG